MYSVFVANSSTDDRVFYVKFATLQAILTLFVPALKLFGYVNIVDDNTGEILAEYTEGELSYLNPTLISH